MMNHILARSDTPPQFPHLGAFESTKLAGAGTDILGTTRHIELWHDDLRMLKSASLNALRYSVPWHRIEHNPGEFDFTWLDRPMEFMQRNGMTGMCCEPGLTV
jgi:hypothetical protein